MKRGLILFIVLLLSQSGIFSQNVAENYYWVQLKDKKGTSYQISHPEDFLSQRAIDRRNRQHIAIDETDLPVSQEYIDSLKNLGADVFHTSKWLNGVTVRTSDTALVRTISALPFVVSVQLTRPASLAKSAHLKFREESEAVYNQADYGTAISQLTQLNGQFLHSQGFRGKGIRVALLDAGFFHVNVITAFDSLRNDHRILGTRDFVDPQSDIYEQHTHGASVLSCMAGNLPGTLIGTAPEASYYLFRTEDAASEYLTEEDNWVAGAELADSLGVDVISSSLGYTTFDDSIMNHTYADMDGKTTRSAKAANMAFQKGILVFVSAGNEGNSSWKYISTPSDGENVIAVAAVDTNGIRATFSSVGPAFGGAVKPNVAAVGWNTYLITSSGIPGFSSGTSFSSPVLAGVGACLLQANPYANVRQVKMAIEQSASQYSNPDSLLGYGIPDFEKADNYLKINGTAFQNSKTSWEVSPNPFTNQLLIKDLSSSTDHDCLISIYNLQGECLYHSFFKPSETYLLKNLTNLPDGLLILSVNSGRKEEQIKVVKVTH